MEDANLIHKINKFWFNDDSDYMFKTSHTVAQITGDMDQEIPANPLQSVEAYFDGSHSWYIGYKTLALLCITQPFGAFLELQHGS